MIRAALLSALLLSPMSAAVARQEPADGVTAEAPLDASPPGPTPPMVVTSDTGAYCQTLSRQLRRYGDDLPEEVASLRDQGQRLCATGQVRGGINRLRRALLALHDPVRDDDPNDVGGAGR